jgi:hypothetical protein
LEFAAQCGDACAMTSFDPDHDLPPDHPRRLVIIAYARLSTLPPAANGMKCTTIAAFGDHIVRLIALTARTAGEALPLWVELYDAAAGHMLDCAGCNGVEAAVVAAAALLAEAKSLNAELASLSPREGR